MVKESKPCSLTDAAYFRSLAAYLDVPSAQPLAVGWYPAMPHHCSQHELLGNARYNTYNYPDS